ncbi:MAG: dicarboxylate/amino acid:cation symporter [Spirochaetaceae bacterium]|jgi:Na+/H+-dicarboxylate symporter|nr:dicarboxylate/amino acid:cation symporter [Spirochaetaceae bacterium]
MSDVKNKGFLGWYFNCNLLYRILTGLVIGAVLGLVFKEEILWISPFGDLFVRLLKMVMMPIILSTMITGASSVSPANLGRVGVRIVAIYMLTSVFAVLIGLGMGFLFHPAAELSNYADAAEQAAQTPSVVKTLLAIVPANFADAVVKESILAVIFFALAFGISLSFLRISDNERIKNAADTLFHVFEAVSEAMMLLVRGVMEYAPIGVLALVATVFATNGSKAIGSLGMVIAAAFTGYAIHIIIVYFGIIKLSGLSLRRFIKEAKNPFITGFVTRSSNGTLPVTIQAANNLGIPREVYSFSLPLGATINMDGTAVYQGVCATFIALSVWGHGFSPEQMGVIVLTASLASIGTAGLPGAGVIMLLMVLDSVGIPITSGSMAAGAYAMILGIDAILDMGRTALNVTGDLTSTAVVAKSMKLLGPDKQT